MTERSLTRELNEICEAKRLEDSRRAEAYRNAHVFMRVLNKCRDKVTVQQFRTLRGQALSGDIDGAEKGLCGILKEKKKHDGRREAQTERGAAARDPGRAAGGGRDQ